MSDVAPRFAWVCTHGESQRWGNRPDGGSYKTDWNSCSLARVDDVNADRDAGLHLARAVLPKKCADLVLGLVLVKPAFVYHALCHLSNAEQTQQTFWASVFGNSLHGKLYFFAREPGTPAFALSEPVNMPIVDKRRLKTFFGLLDVGAGIDLSNLLEKILPQDMMPMASQCQFCVRLPAYFAWELVSGHTSSFALPDPDVEDLFHNSKRMRSRMVGWSHWPGSFDAFEPPPFMDQSEDFSSESAGRIAGLIRSLASRIPRDEDDAETFQECSLAVNTLLRVRDELSTEGLHQGVVQLQGRVSSAKRLPYQAAYLIKTLLVCNHLRDASDLKKVLRRAIEMVLPKSLTQEIIAKFFHPRHAPKIPSASSITRARFILDVALMLFNRERNCKEIDRQQETIRFAMVDSSVQGHYNLELLRVVSVDSSEVVELFLDAQQCLTESERFTSDVFAGRVDPVVWLLYMEAEEQRMLNMNSRMRLDLFPAVALGNQQLYHKFHAVAHSLFLETGSAGSLALYSSQISAFCTDQGPEFALPKIPAVPIQSLFGFLKPGDADTDWADWAPAMRDFGEGDRDALTEPCVNFSRATAIAGLLHIIHNSSADLGKSMMCWDTITNQLQHISRLLRRRDSKTRLMESCFNDPIGKNFHADIKQFQCKLHTGRWGSVSTCILGILSLETVLQFGWDAAKYKGGRGVAAPNEGEDSHQFGVDIAVVDEAIKSQLFWARLKMLESLAIVLRKCLAWAEDCPCHSNGNAVLQREDIPKLWASCPVRGCRAPELAAGDFFQCLTGMWTSQALLYFCLCLAI